MTADKTSPASIPPAKKIKKIKKIIIRIYHLTKSIYSSVVRNSFSCLIVLLAVVWSPELGLYIFLFGWCACWFIFLSCWSVSGRFGSGRKRKGGLTRVENSKQVWVGSKTGRRFGSGWKHEGGLGRVENRREIVPLYLWPLMIDMSCDVMWYSGQSYLVIYRATCCLGLVVVVLSLSKSTHSRESG